MSENEELRPEFVEIAMPYKASGNTWAMQVYRRMVEVMTKESSPLLKRCLSEGITLLRWMEIGDPIEAMMAEQMVWMHARMAYLNYFSTVQTDLPSISVFQLAADRLGDTFRRHVEALANYRHPERKRFTAIRQTNIAQNQIVANETGKPARKKPKATRRHRSRGGGNGRANASAGRIISQAAQTEISAERPWPQETSSENSPQPALALHAWPENQMGPQTLKPKCAEARDVYP
jgi:hypothetical protein